MCGSPGGGPCGARCSARSSARPRRRAMPTGRCPLHGRQCSAPGGARGRGSRQRRQIPRSAAAGICRRLRACLRAGAAGWAGRQRQTYGRGQWAGPVLWYSPSDGTPPARAPSSRPLPRGAAPSRTPRPPLRRAPGPLRRRHRPPARPHRRCQTLLRPPVSMLSQPASAGAGGPCALSSPSAPERTVTRSCGGPMEVTSDLCPALLLLRKAHPSQSKRPRAHAQGHPAHASASRNRGCAHRRCIPPVHLLRRKLSVRARAATRLCQILQI